MHLLAAHLHQLQQLLLDAFAGAAGLAGDHDHPELSVSRKCKLLGLPRSTLY